VDNFIDNLCYQYRGFEIFFKIQILLVEIWDPDPEPDLDSACFQKITLEV
jgi:hypothetical protein